MLRSARVSLFCVALIAVCSVGVSADCDYESLIKYSQGCASEFLADLSGCPDSCKKYLEVVGDCDILPDDAKEAVSQAIANCGEDFTLETGFDAPGGAAADVAAETGGDSTVPTETGGDDTVVVETGSGYSRKAIASFFLLVLTVVLHGI